MRVSDKAIVLQSTRYGDKKYILKLFTCQNGLITAAAAVGKSASSKIKPSSVMPLNLMDVELLLKQNKEIHQLTEASCYCVHAHISESLSKLSIAQFLNEVLIKTLREQTGNKHLFEFIEACFQFLNDTEKGFENLHLYFLTELTKYLGFEPQNNYSQGSKYFDCREGRFSSFALAIPLGLSQEDSLLFSQFLQVNSLHEKLSNAQRQSILNSLLAYYTLHVPGFNHIKSLDVLKEVIAG
ncbi:MAG: DNA repair protein RecO [Bacteroidota bacterium]